MVCRDHWTPDHAAAECFGCGAGFTLFRRRHHCRACGRVYCDACSSERRRLPRMGYADAVRVCTPCATAEDAQLEYDDDNVYENAMWTPAFTADSRTTRASQQSSAPSLHDNDLPEGLPIAAAGRGGGAMDDEDSTTTGSIPSTTASPSAPITFTRHVPAPHATQHAARHSPPGRRRHHTYDRCAAAAVSAADLGEADDDDVGSFTAAARRKKAWKFSKTAALDPDAPATFSHTQVPYVVVSARQSATRASISDASVGSSCARGRATRVPKAPSASGHTKSVTFSIPSVA